MQKTTHFYGFWRVLVMKMGCFWSGMNHDEPGALERPAGCDVAKGQRYVHRGNCCAVF